MAIYDSGSVNVTVGSTLVIGTGTSFLSNISSGNYFRLIDDAAWYEVSAVNSATNIDLTANYTKSGYSPSEQRTGMGYQVVIDYTSNYSYPEMSISDTHMQNIYTKFVRLVDADLFNIVNRSVTASRDIECASVPYGFILKSPDETRFRIKVSNGGTLSASSLA